MCCCGPVGACGTFLRLVSGFHALVLSINTSPGPSRTRQDQAEAIMLGLNRSGRRPALRPSFFLPSTGFCPVNWRWSQSFQRRGFFGGLCFIPTLPGWHRGCFPLADGFMSPLPLQNKYLQAHGAAALCWGSLLCLGKRARSCQNHKRPRTEGVGTTRRPASHSVKCFTAIFADASSDSVSRL